MNFCVRSAAPQGALDSTWNRVAVPWSTPTCATHLSLASASDGGCLLVLDGTAAAAGGLNGLDDTLGLVVRDLAEDDVLAIEPRGYDGGDEELRAIAVPLSAWVQDEMAPSMHKHKSRARGRDLRVGTGVGHGEQEGAVVLALEVLVAELLAVDGLATSALISPSISIHWRRHGREYLRCHG